MVVMYKLIVLLQCTKEMKALDGKIIECAWDGKSWQFMRQRTDKSHPNSYNTAMGRILKINL